MLFYRSASHDLGSPLESSGHKVVPWWDNEDSNNSTICLPSSKNELEGEDDTLSNILNGLNSLGKSSLRIVRQYSFKIHGF